MDIGVVGSGIIGGGFGRLWARAGHRVRFSHSRDPARLVATAAAAGPGADSGTPEEAAAFGDAVLLALPWSLVPGALTPLAPLLAGKTLLTCVVPWGADRSTAALAVGTTTSAAEEVARLAPGARVVAALPLLGDVLNAPTRLFPCPGGGHRIPPTVFVCGDDCAAKDAASALVEDAGFEAVDAGALGAARLLEPMAALLWRLANGQGEGTDIAFKLLRR